MRIAASGEMGVDLAELAEMMTGMTAAQKESFRRPKPDAVTTDCYKREQ